MGLPPGPRASPAPSQPVGSVRPVVDEHIDRLVAGLTQAQRRAVESDAAPLCVLAGAGSGKTTVLTRRVARRIADGSADPAHVLVATFTRKAAGELRSRLRRLGIPGPVWAGTFHAAAFAHLRAHRADRGLRPLAVLDDPARLLRDVPLAGRVVDARHLDALVTEIQWAQSRLVPPGRYADAARACRRRAPFPLEVADGCYAAYTEAKRARGVVDLADLLVECAALYERDAEAAAAMRWRIRHVFVDEFQDLNPAQFRLLQAWLGGRDDLFLVGDPRQAVYGWNGADPTLLERVESVLPGTTVMRLDQNLRSSPQVVAAARAVLGASHDVAANTATNTAPATSPDGPEPRVQGFEDDRAEARALARWLRLAHHPGRTWSQMAVLARTHRRLDQVAVALDEAGVPFRRAGAASSDAVAPFLGPLRRVAASAPLRAAMVDVAESVGAEAVVPPPLSRLADEFALDDPFPTVGGFLAWLDATVGSPDEDQELVAARAGDPGTLPASAGADAERPGGPVVLTTFHRAKGLEWPVVAVVGLEDGLVPIAYAGSAEALGEERRLLYVAMTRAGRDLWCSWAATRELGGVVRQCTPSPFLEPLTAARESPGPRTPATRRADTLSRLAALRTRLASSA